MGNLTKEQLEKRLDEVLAELDTERKKSSQLEIDLNTVKAALEDKGEYSKGLLGKVRESEKLIEQRDEAIYNLRIQLEAASSSSSPAPLDAARESLIREKVRAGLSRKQAEEVIQAQEAEDARRAALEDDEN